MTIKNPCMELPENMAKHQLGKYCSTCNKVVHDFTNASKDELFDFIKKNKAAVCVTTHKAFLDEAPSYKAKYWFASLLTLFMLFFNKISIKAQSTGTRNINQHNHKILANDKEIVVLLIDSLSKKEISDAVIELYNGGELIAIGTTKNGRHAFKLKKGTVINKLDILSYAKDHQDVSYLDFKIKRDKSVIQISMPSGHSGFSGFLLVEGEPTINGSNQQARNKVTIGKKTILKTRP